MNEAMAEISERMLVAVAGAPIETSLAALAHVAACVLVARAPLDQQARLVSALTARIAVLAAEGSIAKAEREKAKMVDDAL